MMFLSLSFSFPSLKINKTFKKTRGLALGQACASCLASLPLFHRPHRHFLMTQHSHCCWATCAWREGRDPWRGQVWS